MLTGGELKLEHHADRRPDPQVPARTILTHPRDKLGCGVVLSQSGIGLGRLCPGSSACAVSNTSFSTRAPRPLQGTLTPCSGQRGSGGESEPLRYGAPEFGLRFASTANSNTDNDSTDSILITGTHLRSGQRGNSSAGRLGPATDDSLKANAPKTDTLGRASGSPIRGAAPSGVTGRLRSSAGRPSKHRFLSPAVRQKARHRHGT